MKMFVALMVGALGVVLLAGGGSGSALTLFGDVFGAVSAKAPFAIPGFGDFGPGGSGTKTGGDGGSFAVTPGTGTTQPAPTAPAAPPGTKSPTAPKSPQGPALVVTEKATT